MQNSGIFQNGGKHGYTFVYAPLPYPAFGSLINEMVYTQDTGRYRYGFNGEEMEGDIAGEGMAYDLGARFYDSRLGKMFSLDPLGAKYPFWSPYSYCGNNPIYIVDIDGMGPNPDPEPGTHKVKKGDTKWDIAKASYKQYGNGMTFEQYWTNFQEWNKGVYTKKDATIYLEDPNNVIETVAEKKSLVEKKPSIIPDPPIAQNATDATKTNYILNYRAVADKPKFDPAGTQSGNLTKNTIATAMVATKVPHKAGEVVGYFAVALAVTIDLSQKVYVTYTLKNYITNKIYVGRTSGFGDPDALIMNRFVYHHMRAAGYTDPKRDEVAQGWPTGYYAIRGREQMLIDAYGGIGSSTLGNLINGISILNPNYLLYISTSTARFGPVTYLRY